MTTKGSVILVGAGPGDPELLTLAGRDALAQAEVVLYDNLIGDGVLRFAAPGAELVPVGKNKGRHPVPQEEINQLLLDKALAGKRVVRLKGGDPYLFGRGAEELELLTEHGIPFRVIPGITSALAAPAYAGIPVTHRRFASSLHILTGHGKEGEAPRIPYHELARLGGTLVFLMGLSAVEEICAGLVREGMAADTPAAAVEKGTRSDQRRVVSTLASLPDAVRRVEFASPTILVVGDVCTLAKRLDWTARLPLWGKRIVCVSSETTASRLADLLRGQGATVEECAAITRSPITQPDGFWRSVCGYDWIVLTSPYGAELFFGGMRDAGVDVRELHTCRFAAVGKRTAEILRINGIIADYVPERYSAADLGEGLRARINPNDAIMLFRAKDGDPDLARNLREACAKLDDIAAYTTTPSPMLANGGADRESRTPVDAFTFTSASSVTAFAGANNDKDWSGVPVFCIGEASAVALRAMNIEPLVSAEATLEAVAECVAGYFSTSSRETPWI